MIYLAYSKESDRIRELIEGLRSRIRAMQSPDQNIVSDCPSVRCRKVPQELVGFASHEDGEPE